MNDALTDPQYAQLLELDVPTKLKVIELLWDSIEPDQIPIPDELVAELDRRKAAADANPQSLVSWEEVKQKLGLGRGD